MINTNEAASMDTQELAAVISELLNHLQEKPDSEKDLGWLYLKTRDMHQDAIAARLEQECLHEQAQYEKTCL